MGLSSMSCVMVGKNLVQDDKGSIGNRLEYSVKQGINYQKGLVKDTFTTAAGIAGSVGAAVAVSKSKAAQDAIKNLGKKVADTKIVKDCAKTLKPYVAKAKNWVSALPKPAKAVLGAGLALTAVISGNNQAKTMYNAGKIDQEYTDNANMQKLIG